MGKNASKAARVWTRKTLMPAAEEEGIDYEVMIGMLVGLADAGDIDEDISNMVSSVDDIAEVLIKARKLSLN